MSDVLVVIPTYNEIDNVSLMIEKIFSISKDFHILIVDDSSPDGTGKVVKSLQKKHFDSLFLLERKKEGLGLAISQVLIGVCLKNTIILFKWIVIFHTTQMI